MTEERRDILQYRQDTHQ